MKLYNFFFIFSTYLAVRLQDRSNFSNEISTASYEATTKIPEEITGTTDFSIDEAITGDVSSRDTTSNDAIINKETEITALNKQSRIIAGVNVRSANVFPSFASIKKNGYHVCGGIIIDEHRILTATHCGITEGYSVGVGGIQLDGSDMEQNVGIHRVMDHENYTFPENDISVIQLAEKLDFSTLKVQPIEIATEEDFEKIKNGTGSCHMVGLGTTDDKTSMQLKSGGQVYMSERSCSYYSRSSTISDHCFMTKDIDGGSQGCMGDSGGPLYCNVGDEMKLFGIASFIGNESCADGWTGWTLPYQYRSFIESTENGSLKSTASLLSILVFITLIF